MDLIESVIWILELLFLGIGSFFDMKERELPVLFLQVFAGLGILFNGLWKYQNLWEVVLGSLFGTAFLVIGVLTKEQIGYGDGIGLVILGILEGFKGMLPIVTGAFLLSGIYGLWSLLGVKKSGDTAIPFFPFLLLTFMGVTLL